MLFSPDFSAEDDMAAGSYSVLISTGEVTLELVDMNNEEWTGQGNHKILLNITEEDNDEDGKGLKYVYTAGEEPEIDYYEDFNELIRENIDSFASYNITDNNEIAFNLFKQIPASGGE